MRRQIADRIAERGPLALQYAKEAVSRGIDMSLEQALRFETDLTVILQTTEDRAEGVRAFLEKRKPEFKRRSGGTASHASQVNADWSRTRRGR